MSAAPGPIHLLLPTHQRANLLRRCLDSLDQMAAELTDCTLHVIENGSRVAEELTAGYAPRLPVRYHHFPAGNKSLALNATLELLPADAFLIFLDDDVAVRPGTVTAFRKAAAEFGPGHFFGGVLHPDYEVAPEPAVVPYLPPSARLVDHSGGKDLRVLTSFTYFMGACWACFARDLRAAGNFSGEFGPGASSGARGQETDAQQRLRELGGISVFVRRAAVDHHVTARMVTADYASDRIFHASIYKGRAAPGVVHTLGMLTKLVYSSLLLFLQPGHPGHRYRIAKAAGYFRGLSQRG
ncbi:GT2 family glycosyltransferase [Lewinella marina]|uniref:glycosyltransferase family 2 protein n=1 Tax=Neolewinella marina TaxID=438751 RepID=UPI0014309650|nr:glycosyltransferase family 2 protein [Neolewinella marina]NJB86649.1 GT2 family glycosyltransferase [Neolewinella marina]